MIAVIYGFIWLILVSLSSRFIFGGDSAELSSIAHSWSIPHPPGYPLYSLLQNIITHLLPFGTIPWRASLLSSIPTVLTSYVLYKILTKLKVKNSISLLVSILYIVLFPVWEYALVPEVFALNSLLVMTITYLLLCYQDSKKYFYLLLSTFLIGLCIAHHHIFVIFVPGWIVLLKGHLHFPTKSIRRTFSLFTAFFSGLLFYLYAPIASFFSPPIQWEDAKTLLGFWRLITRAMYGSFTAYGGSKGNILNQLYDVFSLFIFIFQDFRIIGTLCIIIGIWFTMRKKNIFFQFLFTTIIVHTFFLFYTNFMLSNSFSIGMYERFLISIYALLIIYLALGYNYLYEIVTTLIFRYTDKILIQQLTKVCLFLFLAFYIGTVAITNFRSLSYIKNGRDFDRLGKDIVNTIPAGGIFFASNDNYHFAALYQMVEEKYPTKAIFFQINFMAQKPYMERFKKNNTHLVFPKTMQNQSDLEKFIQLNKKWGIFLETPTQNGFWMPHGLLWKYYESKEAGLKDLDAVVKANAYLWNRVYHIPELTINTRNIMHLQTIQELYIGSYVNYSKLLFLARKNAEAQLGLKNILEKYKSSDKNVIIALMNLYLLDKKCSEANTIAKDIILLSYSQIPTEFIPSIINYYVVCDPHNSQLPILKKIEDKNKDKSLTPLTNF